MLSPSAGVVAADIPLPDISTGDTEQEETTRGQWDWEQD